MARQPTHVFYVDDSGTKEYAETYATRGGGVTPYFVFGGILASIPTAGKLHRDLLGLKLDCFKTASVEIKANWLRRRDQRMLRYKAQFGVSDEALDRFVDLTYRLITESDAELYACAVNKVETKELYKEMAWYPPAIAYECLLQRVALDMNARGFLAHVVMDDMRGATPKHREYKLNLQRQHDRLRAHGSRLQPGVKFDGISGLTFRSSASDGRLQLADLVAYAVYRQFVEFGADWETKAETLQTYGYFKRLVPRFHQGEGRRVQGYGVVKFPRK